MFKEASVKMLAEHKLRNRDFSNHEQGIQSSQKQFRDFTEQMRYCSFHQSRRKQALGKVENMISELLYYNNQILVFHKK